MERLAQFIRSRLASLQDDPAMSPERQAVWRRIRQAQADRVACRELRTSDQWIAEQGTASE